MNDGWELAEKFGPLFWQYCFRRKVSPPTGVAVDVVVKECGPSELEVIKVVRIFGNMGLKDALEIVRNPPKTVLTNLRNDMAESAIYWLAKAGAVAEAVRHDES